MLNLTNYISRIISGLKKQPYHVDGRIPPGYLFSVATERLLMLLRGLFSRVRHRGSFFLSCRASIKCAKMIKVGSTVTIERGVRIDALSTNGISLGNNVSVGHDTQIYCTGNLQHLGKGLIVGNNVGMGTDCFYGCAGGIQIGDDTIVGPFVSFHSENHNFANVDVPIRLQGVNHKGIKVGNNCWIGTKCTILDGAIIGDGCIVTAGAVVKAGIYEPNSVYGGVPAKLLRYRESEVLTYA